MHRPAAVDKGVVVFEPEVLARHGHWRPSAAPVAGVAGAAGGSGAGLAASAGARLPGAAGTDAAVPAGARLSLLGLASLAALAGLTTRVLPAELGAGAGADAATADGTGPVISTEGLPSADAPPAALAAGAKFGPARGDTGAEGGRVEGAAGDRPGAVPAGWMGSG